MLDGHVHHLAGTWWIRVYHATHKSHDMGADVGFVIAESMLYCRVSLFVRSHAETEFSPMF